MIEAITAAIASFLASGGGAWMAIKFKMDSLEKTQKALTRDNLEIRSQVAAVNEKIDWARERIIEIRHRYANGDHIQPGADTGQTQ